MIKSRLASFLDCTILTLSFSCIMLIILNGFHLTLITRLIISSILSSIIFVLVFSHEKKKYNSRRIELKNQKDYDLTMLALKFMTSEEKENLFMSLISKIKETDTNCSSSTQLPQQSENILYNADTYTIGLSQTQTLLTLINNTKNVTFDTFYFFIEDETQDSILLSFIKSTNKDIRIIHSPELYKLIQTHNISISTKDYEKAKKTRKERLKEAVHNLLYRKNTKSFFLVGVLLLVYSYFIPLISYKKYYLTISLILFSISIICMLFGKPTPKHKET